MISASYPLTAVRNHGYFRHGCIPIRRLQRPSLNSVLFLNNLTEPAYNIGLFHENSSPCVVTMLSYGLHIIVSSGTIYFWSPT